MMRVQVALSFIRYCRKTGIPKAGESHTLDELIIIGSERGYLFNGQDFQCAYRLDYQLRLQGLPGRS